MEKEIEHLQVELSTLTALEMGINVKGRMCRKLKRNYKLNKENITRLKQPYEFPKMIGGIFLPS